MSDSSNTRSQDEPVARGVFVRRVVFFAAVGILFLAASAAVVFAIHVFLLLFAGLLFGVFLIGLSRIISNRTSIPYGAALAIVAIALLFISVGATAYLGPRILGKMIELSDELKVASEDIYKKVTESEIYTSLPESVQTPEKWIPSEFDFTSVIGGFFSTVIGMLTGILLIVFVGLYVAAEPSLYKRGIVALVPPSRRDRAAEVHHILGETLWWWLLGRLASMSIIGVATGLGLWLFGIPMPFALGVLAALLTFIPNLGPLLALIPPTLLALRDGPIWALIIVVFYTVLQLVESYLITPMIQQRNLSLPPVVTLGSQLILGVFTGLLGLALATPLAAVGMVLTKEIYIKDVLEAEE